MFRHSWESMFDKERYHTKEHDDDNDDTDHNKDLNQIY